MESNLLQKHNIREQLQSEKQHATCTIVPEPTQTQLKRVVSSKPGFHTGFWDGEGGWGEQDDNRMVLA